MKISRLFILFLLFSVRLFSQNEFIIGTVENDNGDRLPFASVFNPRTDRVVVSDKAGNFMIAAKESDELRIAREGYERRTLKVGANDFSKNLLIKLVMIPKDIEEVVLDFKPTGILKKDVARLNPPPKVMALNSEMSNYMRKPLSENLPKATIPSAFAPKNPGEGQVSLFSIGSGGGGLLGAISGLVKKASSSPVTTSNFAEKQDFYNRVKMAIDLHYYTEQGMDEYDFEIFLAKTDEAYGLSKKYRNNFNKAAIESQLKIAFQEYIQTHSFSPKKTKG